MDESADEAQNPLSEENWMKQNNCKFIKYVIHHRHPMTPEQLKQKPFEEIFKNQHEKIYTDEGSQLMRKRNSPHLKNSQKMNNLHFQTCQNNILNLT